MFVCTLLHVWLFFFFTSKHCTITFEYTLHYPKMQGQKPQNVFCFQKSFSIACLSTKCFASYSKSLLKLSLCKCSNSAHCTLVHRPEYDHIFKKYFYAYSSFIEWRLLNQNHTESHTGIGISSEKSLIYGQ